jgi:class 3 adenylate cyclase
MSEPATRHPSCQHRGQHLAATRLIRAGLHTGECELLGDDDVGGLAVHIGARVSSLAGPGEVLVSSTVRDLIVGSGQTPIPRLKGVPGPWWIFAIET